MNSQSNSAPITCPCGSSGNYKDCCYAFITLEQTPNTAEELMRSRFSAYSVGAYQYIIDTYHPSTRPSIFAQELAKEDSSTIWLTLEVIDSIQSNDQASVCFKAFRRTEGDFYCQHEKSRFLKENNQWFYIDGEMLAGTGRFKPGRNADCVCGSGKKFKRCCG